MTTALRLIDRLSVLLGTVAGVALTVLALFTVVDIVMRYVFNAPIGGSIDIITLALAVMTFCALPYAGRSDGHIVIDLMPDFPNPRVTAARDAVSKLLIAAAFALLAWQGWQRAEIAAMLGEASNMMQIPYAWFFRLMAACVSFYTLTLIVEAALLLAGRRAPPLTEGLDEYGAPRE
jgi:TRAP-type C4-dicarboxylate transport system permease small subunit